MIELELTYLAKYIPDGLLNCPAKKIIDRYLPFESSHPVLRLRKSGEKMELTKKRLIDDIDASRQLEETISLDIDEFEALAKLSAQIVVKTRYYYPYDGVTFEVKPGSIAKTVFWPKGGSISNCLRFSAKTLIASRSAFSFTICRYSVSIEGCKRRL